MALDLLRSITSFHVSVSFECPVRFSVFFSMTFSQVPRHPDEGIQIRIGINSGENDQYHAVRPDFSIFSSSHRKLCCWDRGTEDAKVRVLGNLFMIWTNSFLSQSRILNSSFEGIVYSETP